MIKKAIAVLSLLVPAGCATEPPENALAEVLATPQAAFDYPKAEMVKVGMTEIEVKAILGPPDSTLETEGFPPQCHTYGYIKDREPKYLQVRFTNEKVSSVRDGWSIACFII